MGIIYQFAIRFIKVKDISKVDLTIVSTEDEKNDEAFKDHLIKAKENLLLKLKEISLDPGGKKCYDVEGLNVPEGTEVITFGNDACDRRGGCYYEIYFHYEYAEDDYMEHAFGDVERNRFMIIPKTCTSRLVRLDYCIGSDPVRTYDEKDCEVHVFNEKGVWTRMPCRDDDGYVFTSDEEDEIDGNSEAIDQEANGIGNLETSVEKSTPLSNSTCPPAEKSTTSSNPGYLPTEKSNHI